MSSCDTCRVRISRPPVSFTASTVSAKPIEAGAGAWYRVTLPNRATGYVAASLAEPLDGPIRRHRPLVMSDLLIAPDPASAAIDYVPADRDVDVLGEYDGFALAHGAAGRIGWVRLD